MSYIPQPPPRRAQSRITSAIVANAVGAVLLIAGIYVLVSTAFFFDSRAGWAVLSLVSIVFGYVLSGVSDPDEG